LNTEHVSADVQAQIDAAEARRRRLGLADNPADHPAGSSVANSTGTANTTSPDTPAATPRARSPR